MSSSRIDSINTKALTEHKPFITKQTQSIVQQQKHCWSAPVKTCLPDFMSVIAKLLLFEDKKEYLDHRKQTVKQHLLFCVQTIQTAAIQPQRAVQLSVFTARNSNEDNSFYTPLTVNKINLFLKVHPLSYCKTMKCFIKYIILVMDSNLSVLLQLCCNHTIMSIKRCKFCSEAE